MRLGTGEHGNVGKAWIFYDQIWFTDFINLRAGIETFELPLLTTVRGEPRRLVVRTSKWLPRHREELRQRLLVAIRGAKAALAEKRPERPWIFFHGSEAVFNQLEFEADLQPGVDVLMRDLPCTWNLRLWNGYRRGKRRQPFQDRAAPDLPPNDVIAAHAEQPVPAVPLVPDASMPLSADKHAEPEVPALDVDGGDRPNAPGGRFASVGGEKAALIDVQPSNSIGPQLVAMPGSPEVHEVDTHDRLLRSPATGAAETMPTDEPTPENEPEKAGEPLHAMSPAAINQAEAAEAQAADAERGSDVAGPHLEPFQKKSLGKLARFLAILSPWRRSDTS